MTAPPARSRRVPRPSAEDRERAILTTFERLLEEGAYHDISIDDLARGAGISRPSFYFYFASKDAVLLTLLDRLIEEAHAGRGDALERLAEDPAGGLRESIHAFYATFSAHRAVAVACAEARLTNPEVRELWSNVMDGWVQEAAVAIDAERKRGGAPPGVPARDLATALIHMNERSLHALLSGETPALADESVIDVLVGVWLNAIYGTGVPPGRTPAGA